MAISVIKYLNLQASDVIFLSTRGYKPFLSDYKIINIDEIAKETSDLNLKKILYLKKQIHRFDKLLEQVTTCHPFYAYVPQMSMVLAQILVSNKYCKKFAYIEEGLAYYVQKNFTNHFLSLPIYIKVILHLYNFFSRRIELGHPVFGAFKEFETPHYYYLKSEFAPLRGDVKQIVLNIPSLDCCIYENIEFVLVLGATYEFGMAAMENIRKCYERILDNMKIDKPLYVKLHPSTGDATIRMLHDIAKFRNLQLVWLEKSLEQILVSKNQSNITIGGIDSSLLFYSRILSRNANIYIGYRYLMSLDDIYKKRSSMQSLDFLFNGKFEFVN